MIRRFVCLLVFLTPALPARAAIIHASSAAGPPYDGATWATAHPTVRAALDAAQPGDEVWVAAGTYPESITIPAGVALYGGFNGSETARDQRDPRANVTVLDGERKGNVVIVPQFAPETTVLDGFRIENGSAGHGGGVWLLEASRATISNNVIRNNAAVRGGGIMVETNAAPMISHNILTGNGSAGGGGIEFWTNGRGTVKNNLIVGNSGTGAGIFVSLNDGLQPGPFIWNNTMPDRLEIWAPGPVVTNNILGSNGTPAPEHWTSNLFTAGGDFPKDANGNIFVSVAGFVNPAAGDYRLALDSPAINAGDNAVVAEGDTDLDGRPRTADGRVDIGAYEYVDGTLTVGEAAAALRLAAGLTAATPEVMDRLNVDNTGTSQDSVDISDAIRILRTVR